MPGERHVDGLSPKPDDFYLRVPVFFLSYARPKRTKARETPLSEPIEKFSVLYRDLTSNVTDLVASHTGQDPGFMDTELEGGTRWRQELLTNLGTCQVFVPLLTASYIRTSAWCAMEWDLYTRRKARAPDGRPLDAPVLPVFWAPITSPLPPEIAEVQLFTAPGLPERVRELYRAEGIVGLYRVERGAYDAVVWSLAKEISRLYHSSIVEPLHLGDTRGLRRQFGMDETP
jgi:hypothetical protein